METLPFEHASMVRWLHGRLWRLVDGQYVPTAAHRDPEWIREALAIVDDAIAALEVT